MPTSAVSTRPHVVVVGGGIAGLAAALGVLDGLPTAEVTVLEGSDRLGGKLRLEPVAGHLVDVGAESLLAVRPEAVALAARVGAGDDVVAPSTTSAAVWSRGALRPLPRATLMGVPTDPDSARGVLADDEVERLRAEQEWPGGALQEDVAVGKYVATRLGQAVVDRLVEPLLGGVYAGHASRLSLRATLPTLWERATRGETLLAAPASGPATLEGGTCQWPGKPRGGRTTPRVRRSRRGGRPPSGSGCRRAALPRCGPAYSRRRSPARAGGRRVAARSRLGGDPGGRGRGRGAPLRAADARREAAGPARADGGPGAR